MRKILLRIALCATTVLSMNSCDYFYDNSTPSIDTSPSTPATLSLDDCQSTMNEAYQRFHEVLRDQIFGNGLFYTLDAAGSDIERHGGEQNPGRLKAETFYNGGNSDVVSTFSVLQDLGTADNKTAFALLYNIIQMTNILTDGITPEMMTDERVGKHFAEIYGQALCMKATCYRELIKYYGDVMAVFTLNDEPAAFTSRLDIYDRLIEDLNVAKELCQEKNFLDKTTFTKQYAYALLGRIALEAASYQIYRLDVTNASRLEKHPEYSDINNATYARPTNYKSYYDIAYDAFKYVAENPGNCIGRMKTLQTSLSLKTRMCRVHLRQVIVSVPISSAVLLPVPTNTGYVSRMVRPESIQPSTMAYSTPKTSVVTSHAL